MTQAPPPGAENTPGGYPSNPPPQPDPQQGAAAAPPPPATDYPAAPPPPPGTAGQNAPGAYGQPPAPGYGQPPAAGAGAQISFDASKATNADWAFFGVGVLMLIFSFFGWLSVSYSGPYAGLSNSAGGWNGWWVIIQLVLLASLAIRAVQVFTGNLRTQIPGIAQVAAAGLIILLTLIALIQAFTETSGLDDEFGSVGPGFGIWAYLILSIVFAYLLTLIKQKEGPLPFKVPSIGGL